METFMYAIMSQKKQSAKHQTVMLLRIPENSNSSQEVKLQVKFQVKKHPLTVDTDTQTFNGDNADRHSQTGNRKISASKIQKTSWRTKATRSALRLCLHTIAYLTFNDTSFLLHAFWIIQTKSHGLLFKFNIIANNFCNLNDVNAIRNFKDFDAKCHLSRVSKCKCQLLLYNLFSSEISRKNQTLNRVCYFIQ